MEAKTFHVTCSACGQKLQAERKQLGLRFTCPKCGNKLLVQAPEAEPEVRQAGSSRPQGSASKYASDQVPPETPALLELQDDDEPPRARKKAPAVSATPINRAAKPTGEKMASNRVLAGTKRLPKSLTVNLLKAPMYPMRGLIQFILVLVVQIAVDFSGHASMGIIRSFAIWGAQGYIMIYLFEVLAQTAIGTINPPLLLLDQTVPGVLGLVWEFLRITFKIFVTLLICFWPGLVYLIWLANPFNAVVFALLCVPGLFFLPLSLTALALDGPAWSLGRLISPLKKIFWPYLGIIGAFYLLVAVAITVFVYLKRYDLVVSILAKSFFGLYFWMVAMHMLGCFYWCYERDFDWFDPDKDQQA